MVPNAVPPLIVLGPPLSRPAALLILMGIVVGSILVAVGWLRVWARPGAGRLVAAVAASVLLAGCAACARSIGDELAPRVERFYPVFRDFDNGWLELDRRCGPRGKRIAYAGTDIPYYLFGRGLRNDVRYVNVAGPPGWLMHDWHRQAVREGHPHWEADPRPGWDRSHPDYETWLAHLRAGRIQILVVTRVDPREGRHNVADAEGFPIERVWADQHPAQFERLYGAPAEDAKFRIYRLRDPVREDFSRNRDG